MTVKEMYTKINGDYEGVLGRLMNDILLTKLVHKYGEDKNFDLLTESMKNNNYEDMFTAVHSLKGIALNLGFTGLADATVEMTEELRAGRHDRLEALYLKTKSAHESILACLDKLD